MAEQRPSWTLPPSAPQRSLQPTAMALGPRVDPAGSAPRVMLLSVWTASDATWHARLVLPDASAHEFASPFELARFLARRTAVAPAPGPASPGLR